MNDRLRKAFDEIHAEEELKQKAKQVLGCTAFPEKRRIFHLPRYAFAVLCLLFIFAAFGSYQMYFIPKSAISIDINPSFELEINRFDQVIAVKGYNAEGEELAASLDVKFLKYMDGTIFSCQVKELKPEAGIYRKLLDTYHLDPEKTVFIDDRKENCQGAEKQGIHTVHFQDFKQAAAELEKLGVK